MGNSNTAMAEAPELEEADGTPGPGAEDGDDGDDDEPGWLITYVDGKLPTVVRLEGTPDEKLSSDDVYARFEQADRAGNRFFVLGYHRSRMDLIRSLSWSGAIDLPEITIFESMQERAEGMLEAVEECARNTTFLQQQQAALQQAQAQLFTALEAEQQATEGEDEDEDEEEEPAPPPAPAGRQLRGSGKKLPPGVRR